MIRPALLVFCLLPLMAAGTPDHAPVITATKVADLQFGTFTAGPGGGNVILDPLGTLHSIGDLQATAAPSSPAIFTLTGPPRATFTWYVSPDHVQLGTGNRLNVFAFQAANRTGSLMFDAKGQAQLQIGGTLVAGAICPAGTYRRDHLVLHVSTSGSNASCQATFSVLAGLMTPLLIQETSSLNFGTITAQPIAFTVRVTPAGQRNLAGGGTFSAGAFWVVGQPGAVVALSLPRSGIVLKGPGAHMVLADLTADLPSTFTLSAGGRTSFHVGGTLTVNANQRKGVYTGHYPVTVNYLF
jgi:hypothetical protein